MPTTITVSNAAGLASALAGARGGETILLRGGDYGSLSLIDGRRGVDVDFPSTVTIRSADPERPATFSQVDVRGAGNLAFEGIKFDYAFKAGDPTSTAPFRFSDCENLAIRDCTFDGDLARGVSSSADGFGTGYGLSVQGSRGVVLEGNEAFDFHRGFVIGGSADVVVRNNDLHSMRSDGMNFAQMDGVLIEGNRLHDFRASPTSADHCDMIQFWTNGTTAPSRDVVIRDNVLDIGQGSATQSIFMRNDMVDRGLASFDAMAYRNVIIENNTIINAHSHGISVGETAGLVIRDNAVLHADGGRRDGLDSGVEIPRISVAPSSTGVVVAANATSSLGGWTGQPGWFVRDNAFVQDQDPHAPGWYGDAFVASSLEPVGGRHLFVALPGGLIDRLDAGSAAIQPPPQSLQVLFHVEETDAATRVFDATMSTLDGRPVPSGATFHWTFGDGSTAEGLRVSHAYADGGDHPVTLTVRLPGGRVGTERATVEVDSPDVLSMDAGGRFTAFDDGAPVALGAAARTATVDGLQLGAPGVTASVARAHVADVVGADDMTIAFTLDADRAGASGELFRLHGSFVTSVTQAGELQVQIMRDGAPTVSLTTRGAQLNSVAGVERDAVIHIDDGRLQVWVEGRLAGETAFSGVVGGASGFGSHGLVFGNPWNKANFAGDLTAFDLSVGTGDFPARPETVVLTPSAASPCDLPGRRADMASLDPVEVVPEGPAYGSSLDGTDAADAVDRVGALLRSGLDLHVA